MRINKKKFIYLISPNKINIDFFDNLKILLKTNKVGLFQLRLKKYSMSQKFLIGKKIRKICKIYDVKFIVNDDPILAKKLNADGCHLGQKDMKVKEARKIIGKKIIGITCHNSIKLAKNAIKTGANYIAFGAFYSSNTKKVKYKAKTKILDRAKELKKTSIVAIGGINSKNYKKLLLKKANFLAISSYIWNNKNYEPLKALKKLK